MYQKQILMEKLKEATASVLPISLIVMAISFVLVPVDAGLMLSFVIATAMLILGMGLFTLGADMSMSRIGNYMGSKLTKSRKLPLILTVSFALGVAITVAEPDLQVLAGNVPEIDTTVLILTVSVGVGFFLMLCMVRILFSISLRTMLIVFYAIVFAAAFLSDESILSVAFDSGGVTTGPMTVPFIMALGVGVASIRSDENAKADSFGLVGLCSIGPILSVLLLGAIYKTQPAQGESSAVSGVATTVELGKDYLHALPEYLWEVTMALLPIVVFFLIFQVISLKLRKLPFMRIVIGILYTYLGLVLFLTGVNVGFSPLGYALGAALAEGWKVYLLAPPCDADGLVHHQRRARRPYAQQTGRRVERGRDLCQGDGHELIHRGLRRRRACDAACHHRHFDHVFPCARLSYRAGFELFSCRARSRPSRSTPAASRQVL